GIVILETQQSSDITYRVYDYDRLDAQGCSRDLHIREAIEVTNYSAQPVAAPKVEKDIADLHSTRLIAEKYFTVYHWLLNGTVSTPLTADFLLVSVVDGKGEITVGDRT